MRLKVLLEFFLNKLGEKWGQERAAFSLFLVMGCNPCTTQMSVEFFNLKNAFLVTEIINFIWEIMTSPQQLRV